MQQIVNQEENDNKRKRTEVKFERKLRTYALINIQF